MNPAVAALGLVLLFLAPPEVLDLQFSKPMSLGIEAPGVRLHLVNTRPTAIPVEPFERIVIARQGNLSMLRDFSQLRGLVRISNADAALRFVRLRTSLDTFFAWPGCPWEVEVISNDQVNSLPHFGLRDYLYPQFPGSGCNGILSPSAYRTGRFTPPKSEREKTEFVVTRWLLICPDPQDQKRLSVQKVREFVGEDGQYRRTVVETMPPPELPGIIWQIPLFH